MALEVHIEKKLPEFSLEVNFTADAQPVGILGASGAGKSMTLRCIAGIETPTRGRITLDGRALFDSSRGVRLPSRARQVGLVFQNYALFPHLTVEENVVFGVRRLPAAERASRAAEQLAAAHVTGLERRYPATLSGGEQQRVALARALAARPAALLLDEPFSALDTYLRGALEHQLRETLGGYHGAALLVSHNLEEIYRLCGELVVLDRGKMIARGGRDEIFRRPPGRRVAELTGCKNFSRAHASGAHSIEAIDWGCSLRVTEAVPPALGHCGIRAHHVEVSAADSGGPTSNGPTGRGPAGGERPGRENTFRGWVADSNEGPFSMTLYIRLNQPPRDPSDYHLQVELPRERWIPMNAGPGPYLVRLDPHQVILLAD